MEKIELFFTLLIELLSTFVGVYFGFTQGLKQDRQIQGESRSEEYRQVILTLSLEVETIGLFLEKVFVEIEKDGTKIKYYQPLPKPDCYNSLINSGKFTLIEPKAQIIIAKFYSNIKTLNNLASEYFQCEELVDFELVSNRTVRVYNQTLLWYEWVTTYLDTKTNEMGINISEYGKLPPPPSNEKLN